MAATRSEEGENAMSEGALTTKGRGASASRRLAEYALGVRFDALPQPVVHQARRALLNWFGCVLGAAPEAPVSIAAAVMAEVGPTSQATVLGRGARLDSAGAALVNALAAHLFDFDDTHARSILHPTAATAAACLALGEELDLTAGDVIAAFVAGTEVACRIAAAVTPQHNDDGWHVTGTVGTFGAAAAASRLLALDAEQATMALGLAATQAAGLREMFGSMAKPLHPGKAAWNGLLAARLARKGFTAASEGLEGRRGFLSVMAPDADRDAVTAGLGSDYETARNRFKPYACGVVTHAAIDAAIEARRRGVDAKRVRAIRAHVHPLVEELTSKTGLRRGLEGKFSVFHCIAVGLIDGHAGPAQFTDARVVDADVVALAKRVELVVEPGMDEEAARLEIRTEDGKWHSVDIAAASGSLAKPMNDHELEEKFRLLVADRPGAGDVQGLIDAIWAMGPETRVRDLIADMPVVVEA